VYRFLFIFTAIVVGSIALGQYRPAYEAFNVPWTKTVASIAWWIMHQFDDDVAKNGDVLYSVSTNAAVQIKSGCNGLEGMIVVIAAVVAFPSRFTQKLWGIVLGTLAVQALNIIRVITLYYLNIWNAHWFELAHVYLWQTLIILDAFIFFLLWTRWVTPPSESL
jgi:exosortase H (IPTLxxWG-CTERM-specific)